MNRPALLLYRSTCGKCRILSAAVVVLACGAIRRVPAASPEAARLYASFDQPPGQLAMISGDTFHTGRAIPRAFLMALATRFTGIQWDAGHARARARVRVE